MCQPSVRHFCISLRKNQEVEPLISLLRGGDSDDVFDYLVVSRMF